MRVWVAICCDDTTGVASSPAIYGGSMTGDSLVSPGFLPDFRRNSLGKPAVINCER